MTGVQTCAFRSVVEEEKDGVFSLVGEQAVDVAVGKERVLELRGSENGNDAEGRPVDGFVGGEGFVAERPERVRKPVSHALERVMIRRDGLKMEDGQLVHVVPKGRLPSRGRGKALPFSCPVRFFLLEKPLLLGSGQTRGLSGTGMSVRRRASDLRKRRPMGILL